MTGLIAALQHLSGLGHEFLWQAALVFLRVGGVMAMLPAFGEHSVPMRVRLMLTIAFTAVVAPAVTGTVPAPDRALPGAVAAEVVTGLAVGFMLRLFVHALQIAGAIAAQSVSLSQNAAGPEPQPAIGQVYTVAGLALAMALGLHVRVAEMLILSYQAVPLGQIPLAGDMLRWGLGGVARCFSLAFSLAAPFAIASLLYNVALGIINRAMPQLMVALVGAPAQTLGGLALLAAAAPIGLAVWQRLLDGFLHSPFASLP